VVCKSKITHSPGRSSYSKVRVIEALASSRKKEIQNALPDYAWNTHIDHRPLEPRAVRCPADSPWILPANLQGYWRAWINLICHLRGRPWRTAIYRTARFSKLPRRNPEHQRKSSVQRKQWMVRGA